MKKLVFLLLCILMIVCSASASPATEKPRLSVREFDNKTDAKIPAAAITEMMTTELYKAGLFNLLEREKLQYVADEIKLGQSGLVDESTAPELGKIKGAQFMMTGAVTLFFYNDSGGIVFLPGVGAGLLSHTAYVTLDIRIINTATSEVVYAAAEQGAANQTAGGIVVPFLAFGAGKSGGLLATATRNSVIKHVEIMKTVDWNP